MSNANGPERGVNARAMTTQEVASWLVISLPVLAERVKAGTIPSSRIGRERRFWRPTVLAAVFGEATVGPGDESVPEVVTVEDLAQILQLNPATIRQRIRDGSIPASRIGDQYRIYWPSIRARLAAGQDFTPTQEARDEAT